MYHPYHISPMEGQRDSLPRPTAPLGEHGCPNSPQRERLCRHDFGKVFGFPGEIAPL